MNLPQERIHHLQALAIAERAAGPHPNDVLEILMADDAKKTGLDRKLISLTEEHEVRSWTESLGCTEEELRRAVAAVGDSAVQVRHHLALRSAVKNAK